MKQVGWIVSAVLGVVVGLTLASTVLEGATEERIVCRPSDPEKIPQTQAILFWGNSLAFDHDWKLDEGLVVNCARQGMTALTAATQMNNLPQMSFDAIVLVFGSVELIRKDYTLEDFEGAIRHIRSQIATQYPQAKVIALGVPTHTGDPDVWSYATPEATQTVNDTLSSLADTHYVDMSGQLETLIQTSVTYDGVHLSQKSYDLIEKQIAEQIKFLTRSN